jgi:hypothetical protein
VRVKIQETRAQNSRSHGDQGSRRSRNEVLESDEQQDHGDSNRYGGRQSLGNIANNGNNVVPEGSPRKVNTENLGELVENDNDPDSRLEADQYRLGNKIGNKAQAQERSGQKNGPDHEG